MDIWRCPRGVHPRRARHGALPSLHQDSLHHERAEKSHQSALPLPPTLTLRPGAGMARPTHPHVPESLPRAPRAQNAEDGIGYLRIHGQHEAVLDLPADTLRHPRTEPQTIPHHDRCRCPHYSSIRHRHGTHRLRPPRSDPPRLHALPYRQSHDARVLREYFEDAECDESLEPRSRRHRHTRLYPPPETALLNDAIPRGVHHDDVHALPLRCTSLLQLLLPRRWHDALAPLTPYRT